MLYFRVMNHHANPWKVLAQKPIYENAWISLTEYDVLNPSGGHGIYGKVHFRHLAVGVLPLDDKLNTYLVGQYRFPLSQYSWEIPEGGAEEGEDPLDAAKRELEEETGIRAGLWTGLLSMHLSNSVTDEFAVIYLARQLEQHRALPEATEKLEIKKMAFDEAYRMVDQGLITDSMSVAAILNLRLMLLEGRLAR
jgi:8-oxo-dGTP pyrophosphatase MutT (NUDIX family)